MTLTKLYDIDHFSQEFTKDPIFRYGINRLFLVYDYELETGGYSWTGLTFYNAIGYKNTSEITVHPERIKAYDSVCIEEGSSWLKEAKKSYRGEHPFSSYKHYVMFFEDYGCYEVLARDVQPGLHE